MLKNNKVLILLTSLVLISCNEEDNLYSNSIISSPHPVASEAGKTIYSQGGNAFDAAVAAAFTLSVVEPSMSGIGGRLQVIYKQAEGDILGIDATTQIPESFNSNEKDLPSYGYKTIGIPGVVAGLIKLHEENGVLDLKTVMQPSISIAQNGFYLLPGEVTRQQYEKEKIGSFEGSKNYFLNSDGESFKIGDKLIQKDLANTLSSIAENGKKGFYEGEIAEKIANDIQFNGGFITTEDLKNYSAKKSKVLSGKFNGFDIHTLNLPSYGSITIQMIQIFDKLKIESEVDWTFKISSAIEEAYKYRPFQKNMDSIKSILSQKRAKEIALDIENSNSEITYNDLTKKFDIEDIVQGHTAHLTTSDKYGNVVSLTQTLGPNMGSKVATKGLGFLYNVTMGPYLGGYLGEDKPGDRASSHISPTIFTKNNQVILALGAAGGNKIPVAINQVAYRYLKQNLPLSEALFMPRVYKDDSPIYIERHIGLAGFNDSEIYLKSNNIERVERKGYFGRVHAIALDSLNNRWIGAADKDWEGSVSSYE
ncbi:gamma-glutamyltransferase [Flavobacteriaceae bacterium]|nr:gamma-glutamyltransferase [Flavobacteriaceae bacterium]